MKTILKFVLNLGQTTISLPQGSIVRDIMVQNGSPHIYMEVNAGDDYTAETRTFATYGTGQEFDSHNHNYVGSVQQTNIHGWHVYEIATG